MIINFDLGSYIDGLVSIGYSLNDAEWTVIEYAETLVNNAFLNTETPLTEIDILIPLHHAVLSVLSNRYSFTKCKWYINHETHHQMTVRIEFISDEDIEITFLNSIKRKIENGDAIDETTLRFYNSKCHKLEYS